MTQRVIEDLSEAQCFDLVRTKAVGRFVFSDADGLGAVPVNYGVAGEQIVFRTEKASHLREVLDGPVAFEVDHTDADASEGWSVLIRGTAEEVPMDHVPEILKLTHGSFPHPWGEGVHNVWVAITPAKVTGRRLAAPYFAAIF